MVLVPEVVAEEEVVAAEAEEAVVEGTHQSPLMIFLLNHNFSSMYAINTWGRLRSNPTSFKILMRFLLLQGEGYLKFQTV